jgi:hypothetical protein
MLTMKYKLIAQTAWDGNAWRDCRLPEAATVIHCLELLCQLDVGISSARIDKKTSDNFYASDGVDPQDCFPVRVACVGTRDKPVLCASST